MYVVDSTVSCRKTLEWLFFQLFVNANSDPKVFAFLCAAEVYYINEVLHEFFWGPPFHVRAFVLLGLCLHV